MAYLVQDWKRRSSCWDFLISVCEGGGVDRGGSTILTPPLPLQVILRKSSSQKTKSFLLFRSLILYFPDNGRGKIGALRIIVGTISRTFEGNFRERKTARENHLYRHNSVQKSFIRLSSPVSQIPDPVIFCKD